jgi:hypothetical protein
MASHGEIGESPKQQIETMESTEERKPIEPVTESTSHMVPIYSELNQSVKFTDKVNPRDSFEVWYQSRTSPLDRGEDWQHDTACTTTTKDHGGPEYNFMRVRINQRTGNPVPGQKRPHELADEERDICTACKEMLRELEKTPKPEKPPRQHANEDQPMADDPEDVTQATGQPRTLTEQQRLTDDECDKFINACAVVFEDAWNPPPRESPNEPFWITAARHGLNILALQKREGVDTQTQTEVTIPGTWPNMHNAKNLSNTSTQF